MNRNVPSLFGLKTDAVRQTGGSLVPLHQADDPIVHPLRSAVAGHVRRAAYARGTNDLHGAVCQRSLCAKQFVSLPAEQEPKGAAGRSRQLSLEIAGLEAQRVCLRLQLRQPFGDLLRLTVAPGLDWHDGTSRLQRP
jgi:hypothetical protein